jgi:hypothetical protein
MNSTVKQFIEQQQAEQGKYADLNLENPQLTALQDNDVIVIDEEAYIKTTIHFGGTLNADISAKMENLEMENFRLGLEVSQLSLAYEAEHVKNEALQYYVTNLNKELEIQLLKKKNLQTFYEELQEKVKKMTAEMKEKAAKSGSTTTEADDDVLGKKIKKAVRLMQETKQEEENTELKEKIKKMTATIDSLQEQNINLVAKNKKLFHSAQFFGQVTGTIEKLNAQVQRAKASFERNGSIEED